MAETVGQHGLAAFVNPSNGDALDASVVKGNDNTIRTAYTGHDDDGGIHVQSSLLAARPAAGTVGRKWLTTDVGSVKLWYDNGSAWQEISYLNAAYFATIASSVIPTATNTYDVGTTSLRWKDAYLSGTLTATGNVVIGGSVSAASLSGSLPVASLTGTTLPSSVVTSSLTSTGTLASLAVTGAASLSSSASVGTTLSVGSTLTLQQALEKATISATAATGTINYDALTQAVLYYTTNASGNWTLNIRGSSGVALSSMMAVGQSLTVVFLATNGATPYYPSVHQIDGSAVTPKWLSGTAVVAGNASAIDVYTYTVVRAAGGFTLLASRSYYK
jgi:hypothetical protein